jgi:hypothetical protein
VPWADDAAVTHRPFFQRPSRVRAFGGVGADGVAVADQQDLLPVDVDALAAAFHHFGELGHRPHRTIHAAALRNAVAHPAFSASGPREASRPATGSIATDWPVAAER